MDDYFNILFCLMIDDIILDFLDLIEDRIIESFYLIIKYSLFEIFEEIDQMFLSIKSNR